MNGATILIVDDEPEMLENLDELLSSEGYRCTTLSRPLCFARVLKEARPDLLITDLRMPGADGMSLLAIVQDVDPRLPVVIVTGHATVASAIEAIQRGAFDYLAKPFTADQLFVVVDRALRFRRLIKENRALTERLRAEGGSRIIGQSPPFVRLLDEVRRVAPTEANILITGESGAGKELISRSVHDQSRRSRGPFIPVDCAALPEALLESELFGHEKGSFTGAIARKKGLLVEADGGTVFLDEVAELTPPLQAKLLRALDQRQVRPVGGSALVDIDLRVIAATNRELVELVEEGAFRGDLYYRLHVVHLRIPALRDRPGDVPLLFHRFFEEFCAGRPTPEISPEVLQAVEAYRWPGNVRELRNVVERLVALERDGQITLSDLPPEMRFPEEDPSTAAPAGPAAPPPNYERAREQALCEFRAAYVRNLLEWTGGNVSRAARAAGINRRTLHRWIEDIGGTGPDPGDDAG